MADPADKPTKKAFALRLDPAVYPAVERLAGAELRSINAQIAFLLRAALRARGGLGAPPKEKDSP